MEHSPVNIVCLKWGDKYGPEYVNRLFASVLRNCRSDVKFWCFTDDPRDIDAKIHVHGLPFAQQLDTWWNKLWLFSRDMPMDPGEMIFYVDLDTLITSDISDMVSLRYPRITVLRDFYHGIARTAGNMGSGLMAWNHGQYHDIWEKFSRDPARYIQEIQPLGDQRWIELETQDQRDYWQEVWPGRVVSFKVDCVQGLPDHASIVCYHGRPSIPESMTLGWDHRTAFRQWRTEPAPWVGDHWRDS